MRSLRSIDSVRAALAAALGFTALSCGDNGGDTLGSPEGGDATGSLADTGIRYSLDATASSDSMSPSDATSPYDANIPSDSTSTDDGARADVAGLDAIAERAADQEGPDVLPAGCTPMLVGGQDIGYITCNGQLERHAVVDCPNLIVQSASLCVFDAGGCQANQDCTAMPYGACRSSPGLGGCFCNYGCVRDSDCAAGSLCVCQDPIGQCQTASCNAGTCGEVACAQYTIGCTSAFACQSSADQCETSTDCDAGVCALGVDGGSRCAPFPICASGRPFLVAGEPRLPAIEAGDAWREAAVAPDVRGMRPALRAELARHWTATARMEHASIAAFARFALQLLALGAPPDLLLDAQRAMADETAHAQLAFALASAFGGFDLGPGPIAIDAALDETSLQDLIATTFAEGCIGETAAAVEATEAASRTRDRTVRAALERIAADETRHAQLAWRTVAWALRQADESVRERARRCIGLAETEARDLVRGVHGRDDDHLAAYGVLGEGHKRRLRRQVLMEIVLPSARSLLAEPAGGGIHRCSNARPPGGLAGFVAEDRPPGPVRAARTPALPRA